MVYELLFKSTATERYDTDMNDRVRLHIEQAGVKLVGEFGGTNLGVPEDDPTASDNGFEIESDGEVAQRLSHEISAMLNNRAVYFEEVKL